MRILLSLLCLYALSPVAEGSDQVSHAELAQLNNDKGATPCTVAKLLQSQCATGNLTLETDVFKLPEIIQSECTCNTVYYNLWSACSLYSTTQAPTFHEWAEKCQQKLLRVTENDYPRKADVMAVDIPSWAYLHLTQDSTFDVHAAIRNTQPPNAARIAIPVVVVGLVLIAAIAFAIVLYRRRKRRPRFYESHPMSFRGIRRLLGLLPEVSKVRHSKLPSDWSIEGYGILESYDSSSMEGHGKENVLHSASINQTSTSEGSWSGWKSGQSVNSSNTSSGHSMTTAGSGKSFMDAQSRGRNSQARDERRHESDKPYGRNHPPISRSLEESSVVQNHLHPHDKPVSVYVIPPSAASDESLSTMRPSSVENIDHNTSMSSTIVRSQANSIPSTSMPNNVYMASGNRFQSTESLNSAHSSASHSPTRSTSALTSPSNLYHSNISSESLALLRPSRGDPVLLFPAAVRAAGYSGTSTYHYNPSSSS